MPMFRSYLHRKIEWNAEKSQWFGSIEHFTLEFSTGFIIINPKIKRFEGNSSSCKSSLCSNKSDLFCSDLWFILFFSLNWIFSVLFQFHHLKCVIHSGNKVINRHMLAKWYYEMNVYLFNWTIFFLHNWPRQTTANGFTILFSLNKHRKLQTQYKRKTKLCKLV